MEEEQIGEPSILTFGRCDDMVFRLKSLKESLYMVPTTNTMDSDCCSGFKYCMC